MTNNLRHPKTLGELFAAAGLTLATDTDANLPLGGFTDDSRAVQPGWVFMAVEGEAVDGHRFIGSALEKGAVCVLAEHIPAGVDESKVILVPDARGALPLLAHAWWGNPTRNMTVIGITGTNGKTTTAYLVEALLRTAGRRPALFGTVEYRFEDYHEVAENTTPGALALARLMAEFKARGADSIAMEVSSHSLVQRRVDGIKFEVGLISNVTQDHLDYHHTMEEYALAKRLLFTRHCPACSVFNADDVTARDFAARHAGKCLTYSLDAARGADLFARSLVLEHDAIRMEIMFPNGQTLDLHSPLRGRFNASNLLAAAGIGLALGLEPALIVRGLVGMAGAPGRFEAVHAGQPFSIYVDYAHTPDAVERVLENVRAITPGRVLATLGCGGDRDPGKRPLMGALLGRLADYSIITNDNPRTEDPVKIAEAVEAGMRSVVGPERYEVCLDRHAAIRKLIEMAKAGDSVVIAGKGHENYQIIGTVKSHFDDREIASDICRELWGDKTNEGGENAPERR